MIEQKNIRTNEQTNQPTNERMNEYQAMTKQFVPLIQTLCHGQYSACFLPSTTASVYNVVYQNLRKLYD